MDQGDDIGTSGTIREKLVETKRRWAEERRLLSGRPSSREEDRLPPGQRKVTDWPVLDLGVYLHQGIFRIGRRDAFISAQPLARLGDVIFWDRHVDAQIDGNADLVGDLVALDLGDRAFEHLRIEVKAQSVQVTRLLASKDIARPAEFEIERGETEARS